MLVGLLWRGLSELRLRCELGLRRIGTRSNGGSLAPAGPLVAALLGRSLDVAAWLDAAGEDLLAAGGPFGVAGGSASFGQGRLGLLLGLLHVRCLDVLAVGGQVPVFGQGSGEVICNGRFGQGDVVEGLGGGEPGRAGVGGDGVQDGALLVLR